MCSPASYYLRIPLRRSTAMPSAVWSGHLHFGLVVMPVRLLVAARPKSTRFRRLQRRPVGHLLPATSFPAFPSFAREREDDSDVNDSVRAKTRSDVKENGQHP